MEGGGLCSHDKDLSTGPSDQELSAARRRRCADRGSQRQDDGEFVAIIGSSQLNSFDTAAATRRRCAKCHRGCLADVKGASVARPPAARNRSGSTFPCHQPALFGCDRDEAANFTGTPEPTCAQVLQSAMPYQMSVYAAMRCQPSLPISERLASGVLALPIYNDMTADECDSIVEASAFQRPIRNKERR